jgi:hypothetical protein
MLRPGIFCVIALASFGASLGGSVCRLFLLQHSKAHVIQSFAI